VAADAGAPRGAGAGAPIPPACINSPPMPRGHGFVVDCRFGAMPPLDASGTVRLPMRVSAEDPSAVTTCTVPLDGADRCTCALMWRLCPSVASPASLAPTTWHLVWYACCTQLLRQPNRVQRAAGYRSGV
jgi:hypothetical protein